MKTPKSCFVVALTVTFISIVSGRSVDLNPKRTHQLNDSLHNFGTLKTKDPAVEQQKKTTPKFQEAKNLVSTEKTADDSLKQISKPNSGDLENVQVNRVKRFAFKQTRWRKTQLTFGIFKYPTNTGTIMTREEIWDVVSEAFEHWENVTNIRYEGIGPEIVGTGEVDIAIGWGVIDGSSCSWLGELLSDFWLGEFWSRNGGALAYAYFPNFGGAHIYFDDSEMWGLSGSTVWMWGIFKVTTLELFQVALHEIGHTLGLDHSEDENAVMFKTKQNWTGLSQDDINGVQGLYGEPTGKNETVAYGNYRPSICQVGQFDAVIFGSAGSVFFIGDQFWTTFGDFNDIRPRNISIFKDLPANLDAAVLNNNIAYFFKEDLVYAYKWNTLKIDGFPKQISVAFPGFPDNLDGAFSVENEVYFVKGDYYGKDTNRFQFPSHPLVEAPFDDVEVDANLIRFIKNGKEFVMENNIIPPPPIYSLWNGFVSMFRTPNLEVRDLRHDRFHCKREYIHYQNDNETDVQLSRILKK